MNTENIFRNMNMLSNDISSSRVWCATFLQQIGKYSSALILINEAMSAIQTYGLYYSTDEIKSCDFPKLLYKDSLLTRELNPIEKKEDI